MVNHPAQGDFEKGEIVLFCGRTNHFNSIEIIILEIASLVHFTLPSIRWNKQCLTKCLSRNALQSLAYQDDICPKKTRLRQIPISVGHTRKGIVAYKLDAEATTTGMSS